jgi:molecular chaperone GrpE
VAEPAAEAAHRLGEQVAELERQVAEWKDRALRAAADLDNYRRRAVRERDDMAARAQSELLGRILEVVDDLARVAHLDPAATSAGALHEGMLAIERKFVRVLEAAGVERVDPSGAPFDPNAHEAVTMMPAPGPEADGTVGMVLQPGYRLRGALLRPARVAVMRWTAPAPPVPPADVVH